MFQIYVILAGSIKEDDLCITKDVIVSALCKTNGDLDSNRLHSQLQRHHVDEDDILVLVQLRKVPNKFDSDFEFIYNALHKLQKVDEALLKTFYLCLREKQDVWREHQMLADDLKWESRSEFTIVCVD